MAEKATNHRFDSLAPASRLQILGEIEAREADRIPTGIGEFDRALRRIGVGRCGSDRRRSWHWQEYLAAAGPAHLAQAHKVIYVTGEESVSKCALRARRLNLDCARLPLMAEINLERILSTLQSEKPQVAVIDSIQTLWSGSTSSAPGSVAQVGMRGRN